LLANLDEIKTAQGAVKRAKIEVDKVNAELNKANTELEKANNTEREAVARFTVMFEQQATANKE